MNRSKHWPLVVLTVVGVAACAHAQPVKHAPKTQAAKPSAKAAPLEVRAVASNPSAHVGRIVLTGYVGIATARKGFVLVDNTEYRNEGLACLTVPEPTKIPVVWSGAAPKVRQAVRVDGTLAKTAKGYTFTAAQVGRP